MVPETFRLRDLTTDNLSIYHFFRKEKCTHVFRKENVPTFLMLRNYSNIDLESMACRVITHISVKNYKSHSATKFFWGIIFFKIEKWTTHRVYNNIYAWYAYTISEYIKNWKHFGLPIGRQLNDLGTPRG